MKTSHFDERGMLNLLADACGKKPHTMLRITFLCKGEVVSVDGIKLDEYEVNEVLSPDGSCTCCHGATCPTHDEPELPKAQAEGRAAAIMLNSTGVMGERSSNPYDPTSKGHELWNKGWDEVQEAQKKLPIWQEP